MLPLLALSLGLIAGGRGPSAAIGLSRRQILQLPAAALPFAASGAATASPANTLKVSDTLMVKIITAKKLRATVRQGASNRRSLPLDPTPGANNYQSLTEEVQRKYKKVLLPLQAELKVIAASEAAAALPEEQQKALALQPQLLLGHLSELDYYLKKISFEQYISKTTGEVSDGWYLVAVVGCCVRVDGTC